MAVAGSGSAAGDAASGGSETAAGGSAARGSAAGDAACLGVITSLALAVADRDHTITGLRTALRNSRGQAPATAAGPALTLPADGAPLGGVEGPLTGSQAKTSRSAPPC